MKKTKSLLKTAFVIVVFVLLFAALNRLMQPKYAEDLVEGSMISQYYKEAGGHDVIFVGDCETYANFSPMEMYRQYGISAYVRGTPQQLLWQSYYVLSETFGYEKPKLVILNVNAMRYSEPVSEAFNRLTIDNMRPGPEKIGIIRASMTEDESFLSYVFPILRYHSRFDELTGEDLKYFFSGKDNTHSGFLINKGVKPVENLPAKRPLPDYRFSEICYDYLDKIRLLCQENRAELVLIKAPSVYPYWYEEYDEQIRTYADEYGLKFYNFIDYADEIGIDYNTDTYDAGLHLNLNGAVKLSGFFGEMLKRDFNLPDRREEGEISSVLNEKLRCYDAAIN